MLLSPQFVNFKVVKNPKNFGKGINKNILYKLYHMNLCINNEPILSRMVGCIWCVNCCGWT
jgi:hypothetical protein